MGSKCQYRRQERPSIFLSYEYQDYKVSKQQPKGSSKTTKIHEIRPVHTKTIDLEISVFPQVAYLHFCYIETCGEYGRVNP